MLVDNVKRLELVGIEQVRFVQAEHDCAAAFVVFGGAGRLAAGRVARDHRIGTPATPATSRVVGLRAGTPVGGQRGTT